MTTGQKILKRTLIVFVCLGGLTVSFLATRKPWVKPLVPGVQLSPTRPILRPEDVDPNGAFGKLQEGFKVLDDAGSDKAFVDTSIHELAKLNPTNADIVAALERLESGLVIVREAVTIPTGRQVAFDLSYDARLPHVAQSRSTYRILAASARWHAATGDIDTSLDEILTSLRMGEIIGTGGLIHMLVRSAITSGSCSTLAELSWRYDLASDDTKRLAMELSQMDRTFESLAETCRYECGTASNSIEQIFQNPASTFNSKSGLVPYFGIIGAVLGSTPDAVRKNISSAYSHLIASEMRSPVWHSLDSGLLFDMEDFIPNQLLLYRDPLGLMLVRMIMPAFDGASVRYHTCRLNLRATIVALALDQYEQMYGKPPLTLDILVPEFMDSIPEDPFLEGKPLIYKTLTDRHWIIYSVGTNGVDDGGVFADKKTDTPDIGISTHQFVAATNGVGE